MKFDPSDYQDLSTLQNSFRDKKILDELEKLNSRSTNPVSANRQCPWCGGGLAGEFEKCQNCGSNISWVRGFPCKPGSEKQILGLFIQNDEIQLKKLAKQKKINKVMFLILAVPAGVVIILILLALLLVFARE
jgi:hypothetical protein